MAPLITLIHKLHFDDAIKPPRQDEAVLSECIASLEAEYNATGKANKKQEIRPVNVGAELSTLCSGAALAVVRGIELW